MYDLIETTDGGFLLAGEKGTPGQMNGYLMKVDKYGEIEWEKITDHHPQGFICVERAADGNLLTLTYDGYPIPSCATGIVVTKIREDGDLVWEKKYQGSFLWMWGHIAPTADGGGVVVSNYGTYESLPSSPYVLRFDIDGMVLWDSIYQFKGKNWAITPFLTEQGGFLIGGETWEGARAKALLFKIDQNGRLIWEKVLQSSEYYNRATDFSSFGQGKYLVAGERYFEGGFGNSCPWAALINENGGTSWVKNYPMPEGGDYFVKGLTSLQCGKFLILGNTYWADRKTRLLMVDQEGDLFKYYDFEQFDAVGMGDCIETSDGSVVAVGSIDHMASRDVYLIKFRPDCGPDSLEITDKLDVFPNPFLHSCTIRYNSGKFGEVFFDLYHASGIRIRSWEIEKSVLEFSELLDLKNQPSGVYFLLCKDKMGKVLGRVGLVKG